MGKLIGNRVELLSDKIDVMAKFVYFKQFDDVGMILSEMSGINMEFLPIASRSSIHFQELLYFRFDLYSWP